MEKQSASIDYLMNMLKNPELAQKSESEAKPKKRDNAFNVCFFTMPVASIM